MTWISINTRMPIDGGKKFGIDVLLFTVRRFKGEKRNSYNITIGRFAKGVFYIGWVGGTSYPTEFSRVTHWQYMPKYPKIK